MFRRGRFFARTGGGLALAMPGSEVRGGGEGGEMRVQCLSFGGCVPTVHHYYTVVKYVLKHVRYVLDPSTYTGIRAGLAGCGQGQTGVVATHAAGFRPGSRRTATTPLAGLDFYYEPVIWRMASLKERPRTLTKKSMELPAGARSGSVKGTPAS